MVELLGALDTHLLYRAKRNGKLGIAATEDRTRNQKVPKGWSAHCAIVGLTSGRGRCVEFAYFYVI